MRTTVKLGRREFLAAAMVAPVAGVAGRAKPLLDRGFARVTRIADGVFATIADPHKGLQCYSNGGVIAGRDAVLIIEGHFQPEGAALEIEVAREVSHAPIRGVVDTHWHLDHTFGNEGYASRRIPILAHEQVTPLMQQRYARRSEQEKAETLARWERRLADATDPIDKAHRSADLAQMKWILDAVDHASLSVPTEPLAAADLPKTIDLGGLTAVIEFHRGHSQTDLIIRVPERDVVFAGDLFFNRAYPVISDTDILAWRRVIDLLSSYDHRTQFVPGHGPLGRVDDVRGQAVLMDHLREHAEQMMRTGATVDEAERSYQVPARFRSFEILSWAFTIGGAMRMYFEALKQGGNQPQIVPARFNA